MLLSEVFAVAVIQVFVVEDYGDCLVGWHGYNFDSVHLSDAVMLVLVFFDSFLCVAHF